MLWRDGWLSNLLFCASYDDQVFEELSAAAKGEVIEEIQELIKNRSHVFRVDVHLSFAIRVLAHSNSPEQPACFSKFMKSGPLRLFGATSF